jgi:hypothetical protein
MNYRPAERSPGPRKRGLSGIVPKRIEWIRFKPLSPCRIHTQAGAPGEAIMPKSTERVGILSVAYKFPQVTYALLAVGSNKQVKEYI